MKFSGGLVVGLLVASISLGSAAKNGKVYTWTDNQGVVHFGEHPPKDVQAKLVKTRTGHSDPTPAPTSGASAASSSASFGTTQPSRDSERCKQARDNLNVLNTVARIRTQNADGATVYLTEDDKANQRERMNEIIAQECE